MNKDDIKGIAALIITTAASFTLGWFLYSLIATTAGKLFQ